MSYIMHHTEQPSILLPGKYKNPAGHTECVEFVRQVTSAPATYLWKKGLHIQGASSGAVPRGTAIATFDANGKYPTDALGKHAAIYLGHSSVGIDVLDQWASLGAVKRRTIRFNNHNANSRSDKAEMFYVIE
ncbi:MAG: BPSL0067 family protein [Pseudomonadota bacterium]